MRKIFVFLFFASLIIFIIEGIGLYVHKHTNNAPVKQEFTFWSIQLKPVYERQMREIIKDFERKNPGYRVTWVDIPIQEAQKRTLASILSKNPPDLINLNPEFSLLLAQRNALYYFSEEEAHDFHPNLVEKLKYKNKIYALPFYATSPVSVYNKAIYNECISDKFIKTYDELFEISSKLYHCSDIHPFVINLDENDTLAKILNKYGISSLNDEESKQKALYIYSMFNNMYKSNYLAKDTLTINHREMVEKYMSKDAVIMVAGSNFINMIKQNAPNVYAKTDVAPQLTGTNGGYDVSIMNLVIPKKSKNITAALDFIQILTNEQNQYNLAQITNVLPANREALSENYFLHCQDEPTQKARCISALQINNLNNVSFGQNNKKAQNEAINKTLEEILLNKGVSIKDKIDTLSRELSELSD